MPMDQPADSELERRVLKVFEGALEVAPPELPGYLEAACRSDATVRARVEALLSLHAEPSSPLESAEKPAAGEAGDDPVDALLAARPEFARLLGESCGAAADDASPAAAGAAALEDLPPLSGEKPRYARGEEIARGGMGVIYRVWDDVLRRSLAVKVSREKAPPGAGDLASLESPQAVSRFLEEARVTAQLDHPGVVPLHDIGLDREGRFFFTMRLVEGLDLSAVFALARERRDGWSPTRALNVLVRVCETLAYAHSKGVIHRDLKPQNVMVGRYGETYVMDWGLAKVRGQQDRRDLRLRELSEEAPLGGPAAGTEAAASEASSPVITVDGTIVGTPSFMPPEQAAGRGGGLDQRADIYAVGAMLYALLAGHPPHAPPGKSSSARQVVAAVRRGPPAPLREVAPEAPPELVAVCEKAMARSPADRYATMDELGEDLRAYLENRVVRAHRTGAVVELRKWVARNRATAASLVGLLVILVAGLAASLWALRSATTARDDLKTESTARAAALVEKGQALQRAESTRLCAQSAAVLETDPGQALLMAVEAARLEPGYRADTALLAALGALREERTLIGSSLEVNGVAFTPDGGRAVTAGRDGAVRVWDAASGEELLRLWDESTGINGCELDAAGLRLVSFTWRGAVLLWEVGTGRLLRTLAHPREVDRAVFSPDGRRLLTVCRDGKGRLWQVEEGGDPLILHGHAPGELPWGGFSADGRHAITASHDRTARIWDAETGETLRILTGHDAPLVSAELGPGGRLAVTAATDDTACLWDAASGEPLHVLEGHERWLRGASFSPDGRWIITASSDATARLWDAASGKLLHVLAGHEATVNTAAFSRDARQVLTASDDRTARLWDPSSGKELAVLRGHQSAVIAAAFSRDGRRAITGSRDNTARIWDTRVEESLARVARPRWDRAAHFSPDGSRVIVAGTGRGAEIREAATGQLRAALAGHEAGILGAAFSRDGSLAATASADATARVWDAASGREIARLAGHDPSHPVLAVAFSPDASLVATGAGDYTAALWEAATGKLLHRLKGHNHRVNAVVFHPDGKLLATASDDHTVGLWRVEDGQPVGQRLNHRTAWLHAVRFSPDGQLLLTASLMNVLFVWDAPAAKLVARLVGHDADFIDAAFAAAGDRVVTLHADGAAHVWELPSGRRRATVRSEGAHFRAAGFDPGGNTLWTEASDGTRRQWPLEQLPVALARRPREPTPYDRVRLDLGSPAERKANGLAWTEWYLARAVQVGERSWANDPHYCEGLFQHARSTASVIAWLVEVNELVEPRLTAVAASQPGGLGDLLERGIQLIERASSLPKAPAQLREMLAAARRERHPALPTYGTVDAALAGLDRSTLVPPGATWRVARGAGAPSPNGPWTTPELDDSGWEALVLPLAQGYDTSGARLDDMAGKHSSVYARRRFSVQDPTRWSELRITVRHDDGFIAYLNGVEVVRIGAGRIGETPPADAVAARAVGRRPGTASAPVPARLLRSGENVIALRGLNAAVDDPDFFLEASLEGEMTTTAAEDEKLLAAFTGAAGTAFARARRYLEGRLLQRQGQPREAAARFRSLRDEDPTGLEVLCRLVECLRASGGAEEADGMLQAALAARPSFPETSRDLLDESAWSILRLADQGLEDYYRAARWADRAHSLAPPVPIDIPSRTVTGVARYRLGLYHEARARLELTRPAYALLNQGRSHPRDLAFLAMTYHRLGLEEEARRAFRDLRDPARVEGWLTSPYVREAAILLGIPVLEDDR